MGGGVAFEHQQVLMEWSQSEVFASQRLNIIFHQTMYHSQLPHWKVQTKTRGSRQVCKSYLAVRTHIAVLILRQSAASSVVRCSPSFWIVTNSPSGAEYHPVLQWTRWNFHHQNRAVQLPNLEAGPNCTSLSRGLMCLLWL